MSIFIHLNFIDILYFPFHFVSFLFLYFIYEFNSNYDSTKLEK
jgi:hypothetical protein